MDVAQAPVCEKARDGALATAFGWAQRTVRRQIDTLRRLASVVLERMDAAFDGAEPDDAQGFCDSVLAIEKAVLRLGELHWIARLIDALRAKLADDLRRLEHGEAPERVFASKASDAAKPETPPGDVEPGRPAAERSGRGDAEDREAFDRLPRGFGRDDFSEILKRPTDESSPSSAASSASRPAGAARPSRPGSRRRRIRHFPLRSRALRLGPQTAEPPPHRRIVTPPTPRVGGRRRFRRRLPVPAQEAARLQTRRRPSPKRKKPGLSTGLPV